jgi:hypothetical protein
MKNITVTVTDEIYRHARMWAARENTTVTSLVRKFLETPREPSFSYMDLLGDEPDAAEDTPYPPPHYCETVKL